MTEWRYLLNGKVSHGLSDPHSALARCGVGPWVSAAYGWLGTGSQLEYEVAAALPKCQRCVTYLTLDRGIPRG